MTHTKVLLLLFLLLLAGCQTQSPLRQSADAQRLYTETLTALTQARQAGLIGDDEARAIEKVRIVAAAALDRMEVAALEGRVLEFRDARAVLDQAIDAMLAARIKARRKHE